ncbi:hypothetical protein ACIA48_02495 [Mycobacterium sp. NPDC051804]|uniref:hypothetical protein n=1 Tax=Mycobacterium sp. NPDC051804 TaxID=3364295 RepID=UPI003788B87A
MVSPEFGNGWLQALTDPDDQMRTAWVDLEFVREVFYADCDKATADAALGRLRPQSGYPWALPCSMTEHPPAPVADVLLGVL